LLTLTDCVPVVEEAFRMRAEGRALSPGLMHINADGGEFHIKAGGLRLDRTYVVLKANGGFFQNRKLHGLPNIQGVILLFDGGTGTPLAVMDSVDITILRTGAATAIAARVLARPGSSTALVCGCGNQGRIQLAALRHALPALRRAFAYDSDPAAARAFASETSASLGLDVAAETDLGRAAAQSDAIVTCTPAKTPFLLKRHVRPGTFVAAVGADSPDKQELEPALLAGAKVVVDILDQCARVGELHHALEAGLLTTADVHGELGEVLAGRRTGRTDDAEITIFDATGTALQDAAAAVAVYRKALERGLGIRAEMSS
jgi:ornithine cyclodeaminase/alanine dehydrogenase